MANMYEPVTISGRKLTRTQNSREILVVMSRLKVRIRLGKFTPKQLDKIEVMVLDALHRVHERQAEVGGEVPPKVEARAS